MNFGHQDSAGRPIKKGDRVRWRGEEYTVKGFRLLTVSGRLVPAVEFVEPLHLNAVPDEMSVDLITSPDNGTKHYV
jgi:hypothetical protein